MNDDFAKVGADMIRVFQRWISDNDPYDPFGEWRRRIRRARKCERWFIDVPTLKLRKEEELQWM